MCGRWISYWVRRLKKIHFGLVSGGRIGNVFQDSSNNLFNQFNREGVSASVAAFALLKLLRSLVRQPVSERNLSHLHHLDLSRILANGRADKDANRGRESSADSQVFQVVLTGGPCAGKSSAIEYFASKIRKHGFDVYQVPEVPTLLLNGGCVYPGLDGGDRLVAFETSLIELQLQMEQTFYNVCRRLCFIIDHSVQPR